MITRLLVANRGEIARRIMRSARSLGIETAVVFSDVDATAPFVAEADVAVRLPGSLASETYLNAAAVVDAARRVGADAVHPGYGFLAENPDFARDVREAGLAWVGPTPEAMAAMALKREAKALVAAAGVPLLPSADLPADPDSWAQAGESVGYPLLVKASAGGGGRGMRMVQSAAELSESVIAAQREASAAFGDGTVFLERLVTGGRHVEVQVMGDHHGGLLHLFERECSVQRRHQKVLEETPSPGIVDSVREAMLAAALSVGKAIGYTNAGTVEFLVSGEGEAAEFFFLEMNTRLQVEHPVTELVTGLDVVAMQLAVADGERLARAQEDVTRSGHAIEVRLVAEDPANGWVPSSGVVTTFETPDVPGVRWDTAVVSGSSVPAEYDSLIAKVISHGATRDEARRRLVTALRGLRVHGVKTNRDMLVGLLRDADVAAGRTTTDLLDNRPELNDVGGLSDAERLVHVLAGSLCSAAARPPSLPGLAPRSWRVMPAPHPLTHLVIDERDVYVRYAERPSSTAGATSFDVELMWSDPRAIEPDETAEPPTQISVTVAPAGTDAWWLEHDGVRHRVQVHSGPESDTAAREIHVAALGRHSVLRQPPRLPVAGAGEQAHGPSSPVPGTVVGVLVTAGDTVQAGDALVVLEAMKMEHRITAQHPARVVEVPVEMGQSVDAHEVLVVLEPLADDDEGDGSGSSQTEVGSSGGTSSDPGDGNSNEEGQE